MGLALPLDKFSFALGPSPGATIAIDPDLRDDPASWHFERLDLSPDHAAALAVRGPPPRVAIHAVAPEDLRWPHGANR